jgi:hypothetical protein
MKCRAPFCKSIAKYDLIKRQGNASNSDIWSSPQSGYLPDISSKHCLAVLLYGESIFVGLVQESADGKEVPSFSECALKLTKKIETNSNCGHQ